MPNLRGDLVENKAWKTTLYQFIYYSMIKRNFTNARFVTESWPVYLSSISIKVTWLIISICDSSFTQKSSLATHVLSVHLTFKREVYDTTFASKGNLTVRIGSVYGGIVKKYQCNICDSFFTEKSKLGILVLSVHERKKSFECDLCNSRYTSKTKLDIHKKITHESQNPFFCNFCGADFTKEENLKRHVFEVHNFTKNVKIQFRLVFVVQLLQRKEI